MGDWNNPVMVPADARTTSPWESVLPTLLTNLVLTKIGQNFQAKQAELDRTAAVSTKQAEMSWEAQKMNTTTAKDIAIQQMKDKATQQQEIMKGLVSGDISAANMPGGGPPSPGTIVGPEGEFYQSQVNPTKLAVAQLKASNKKSGSNDKGFAPDMEIFINRQTGEEIPVNMRNQLEVEGAMSKGFSPVGPEERGYSVEFGKSSAKFEAGIIEGASKSLSEIATLDTMDQLLDRFTSGKFTPAFEELQSYANAFGLPIDTKNLGAKESFDAISSQLALQSRHMGMTGPMSDKDIEFLKVMNPQLITSKGGNRTIIKIRKKMAERENRKADLLRQYKQEHKGRFDPTEFNSYLATEFKKESIFGIPDGSVYVGDHQKTGLPAYKTPDGRTIIPEF